MTRVIVSREYTYLTSAPTITEAHFAAGDLGQTKYDFIVTSEGKWKARALDTREHLGTAYTKQLQKQGLFGAEFQQFFLPVNDDVSLSEGIEILAAYDAANS